MGVKLFSGLILVVFSLLLLAVSSVSSLEPDGAEVNETSSERAPIADPQSAEAQAGNVTELHISGFSSTRTWQGYFGNVTGTIQLADSLSNVMYNWSNINPHGQIYASTNETIHWENVQCFNFTAAGTYDDDTANAGGTSQFGTNLTQLHAEFNIPDYAVDGVNDTFNLLGVNGHDLFYTSKLEFGQGQCPSTKLYDFSGDGVFQEALMYEPESRSVIFNSILEQGRLGFDNRLHDFQMLVLDDGRGTNTDTTTYYFYVELE